LIMKKHALKSGVDVNITAHMFRHTCCTLAIEGGAKPQQVQSHLRHKDLKTTMRYYENREKLVDNASDYIKI
jgi:integrase